MINISHKIDNASPATLFDDSNSDKKKKRT